MPRRGCIVSLVKRPAVTGSGAAATATATAAAADEMVRQLPHQALMMRLVPAPLQSAASRLGHVGLALGGDDVVVMIQQREREAASRRRRCRRVCHFVLCRVSAK